MGTIDKEDFGSDSGECILCLDCAVTCPEDAISFRPRLGLDWHRGFDPGRREALGGLAVSLGLLALTRTDRVAHQPRADRLRPPGVDEDDLLAACVRCGACVRTCPSHGLQPSVTQSGIEGLWTPILVPRLGHCDYSCTACGQVCPTGAIPRLTLAEKRQTPLGKAYIDQTLCIAWSGRAPCIVCEEMCPVPDKAIHLEERQVAHGEGDTLTLQMPIVRHERCIGCGLCESKCPVQGQAAIRVRVDPL
jgi:MauM/NapG family ferredoxin protein